jgi:hypothetical protein
VVSSTVRISDCMQEQVDLQKKYDYLLSCHFRTQKSFWALEDKLEEYEGENSREAELISEIVSLKKQIGSLKRQVSRLQSNYPFILIICFYYSPFNFNFSFAVAENNALKNPRRLRSQTVSPKKL